MLDYVCGAQDVPQFHEIRLRQGERIIAVHIGSSSCLGSLVALRFKGACRRPLVGRKKLEKLFEYESKRGAAIWAEDLMLLDAYDLNHDAGTCISLRPSDDSHRNTMGSERHNVVGLHDLLSVEWKHNHKSHPGKSRRQH